MKKVVESKITSKLPTGLKNKVGMRKNGPEQAGRRPQANGGKIPRRPLSQKGTQEHRRGAAKKNIEVRPCLRGDESSSCVMPRVLCVARIIALRDMTRTVMYSRVFCMLRVQPFLAGGIKYIPRMLYMYM